MGQNASLRYEPKDSIDGLVLARRPWIAGNACPNRGRVKGLMHATAWLMAKAASACAALILAITAIILYEIVSRFVFDEPTIWGQEIAVYLLLACAFLGLAPTLHAGEHIRIDLVVRRLPPGLRHASEFAACLGIAVFAAIAAWGGCGAVTHAFKFGQRSLTLLSVPVWIPHLVVPAGMLLLLLVALLRAWQALGALRGKAP
jgi:TRAP-type C4-dicarboxylate transport system permease small subunit